MRINKTEDTGPCAVVVNKSGPKRCGAQTAFVTELDGHTYRICMPHIEAQRKLENELGDSVV